MNASDPIFALRAAETDSMAEAMSDYLDLCVLFGLRPFDLRAWLAGLDLSDETDVSHAIRTGIARQYPHLEDAAHHFIRVICRPSDFAMAAE